MAGRKYKPRRCRARRGGRRRREVVERQKVGRNRESVGKKKKGSWGWGEKKVDRERVGEEGERVEEEVEREMGRERW